MRTKIVTILVCAFIFTASAQSKKWSLQECIDYALENNISLKQDELTSLSLEEDIRAAKGNFYPNFNISGNQNWNFGSFIGQDGSRISQDSRTNTFSASTGVTLFNGLRNRNSLLQAKKTLEAAGFDIEESKNNIMLFVVNSYLNVLLSKENLVIVEDQVVISKSQVTMAKEMVEAGSSPRVALLEAESTLAANYQQLTNAQNEVDLALLSLAQLLQTSHKGFDIEDVMLEINSSSLKYNDTDEIFNTAVSILPEIKSSELGVENSQLSLKIAKGANIPSLTFGGGFGSSYQHRQGSKDELVIIDPDTGLPTIISNGFGKQMKDNFGTNFGFGLSIPVFNNFRNKVSIEKAKINIDRAELQLLDRKIQLREAVEKAYADAKASLNEFISAEKSLIAQEESFKNAQTSYNAGVMTSFDFDQTRNRLVNAQASLVNAKYNFVFRTKLLEYYLGIPIEF